jgi:lipopolysaccharide export LptBFGC system permease protein LptF
MKKEENIFNDSEGNLNEIAPKLFSAGTDNPFDVPENYFDSLPAMIVEKCNNPSKANIASKFKAVFSSRFLIPATVSIAVLIIAIMIYNASDVKTTNTQTMAYTENNTSAEVMYIDSLIDNGELDESLLVETFAGIDDTSKNKQSSSFEKNISEINKSTIILNDSTDKVIITDDDIINYLLDNDDEDDIIDY